VIRFTAAAKPKTAHTAENSQPKRSNAAAASAKALRPAS
jgi:hypothetical protein